MTNTGLPEHANRGPFRIARSAAAVILAGGLACGCSMGTPRLAEPMTQAQIARHATGNRGASEEEKPLAGRTIVVDPGHNGKYKKSFNTKKVPAGNGKKKACNSSGTTGKKLPEHAYNWAQANLLKVELERRGAHVLMTRKNDAGLGPCVNKRAKVANDAKADLLISIHADGNYAKKARGYHVIISTTMAGGSELEKSSKKLAKLARTEMDQHTQMPRSTYIGHGTALSPRSDIATVNLLKSTPGIMMEMGNMRHAKDLALLKLTEFRQQVAQALADAGERALNS
ncbi:MAG: N-acetylmuramoyl-L-alanine amidase [Micropruina sp.]